MIEKREICIVHEAVRLKKLRGLEPGRRKDLLLAEAADHQVQTS
jgi:hypothetical protein